MGHAVSAFVVSGFVNGCIYALIAVAIVIVYQITGVLNFALRATGMIAAYCFTNLSSHMNAWLAFLLLVIAAGAAGVLLGILSLPVQHASSLRKAVATLGLLSVMAGLVTLVWGQFSASTPALAGSTAFRFYGFPVTWQRVIEVVAALVLSLVAVVFFRTGSLGSALRAMATSVSTSRLVGLPVRSLWVLAWAISTALAAFVAIMVLPDVGLTPTAQTFIVFVPIAAALVARFTSIELAALVALALGITEGVMQGSSATSQYIDLAPLAAIVGSLLFGRLRTPFERV